MRRVYLFILFTHLFILCILQVQQMFPDVLYAHILEDLRHTHSLELTIDNILEQRMVNPPPMFSTHDSSRYEFAFLLLNFLLFLFSLRYSFSDISLSVCLFTCVYTMLVALSMCLRVGAGIVGGSCEVPTIAIFLAPRWVCR